MCGKRIGFGLFSDSLESQSYSFDAIEHMKPLFGVEKRHKSSFKSQKV